MISKMISVKGLYLALGTLLSLGLARGECGVDLIQPKPVKTTPSGVAR